MRKGRGIQLSLLVLIMFVALNVLRSGEEGKGKNVSFYFSLATCATMVYVRKKLQWRT